MVIFVMDIDWGRRKIDLVLGSPPTFLQERELRGKCAEDRLPI